jgi:hypothetical protein
VLKKGHVRLPDVMGIQPFHIASLSATRFASLPLRLTLVPTNAVHYTGVCKTVYD